MIYLVQVTDFAGMTYLQTAFLVPQNAESFALKYLNEGYRVNVVKVELGDKDVCISCGLLGDLDSFDLGSSRARQN